MPPDATTRATLVREGEDTADVGLASLVGRWMGITVIVTVALVLYGIRRIGMLSVSRAERRAAVAHLRGRTLRWAMERLGAAFIKLGQVMSTRRDLFDPEVIDELRQLQDKLPAFSFSRVRSMIEQELGGRLEDHFAELDPNPVAAASVAQVHHGRLHDGSEVAVKVLRPDIRQKALRDGRIMMLGARFLSWLPGAKQGDPVGHTRHFVEGIIDQTDLTREIENYARFRRNFADFPGIVFPRVHEELSTGRVLTMEFIHGTKCDELGPGDHSDVVRIMRESFLKMLFEDGFLHVDLHPGNFVITDDRRVAIFDVGLVKGIGEKLLVQYIDFSRCIAFGTADDFVRHFRTYHRYMDHNVDWDGLTRDTETLVGKLRGKSVAELETGALVADLFDLGRRYEIRPETEMTLLMVGMMTAEGVGKMLDAETDSIAEIGRYLMPLLERRGMLSPEWGISGRPTSD